ncbi:MAG: GDP-mannose 4,6-dehydratase [Nitrospinales bacterium]
MRNLITGINGFAASHLCDLLLANGEEVFGIARTLGNADNIKHVADRVRVFPCDVRVFGEIREVLEQVRPDRIYHMASVSFVPAVTRDWSLAFETNVLGTFHLLEAVRQLGLNPRVLCVGSSEEYGATDPEAMPIRETALLQPISLYGVTKASADLLAASFSRREELDILRVRPFNHVGPRQQSRFVCSSFARQIAEIEVGKNPVLKVGNLEAQKDFTDVRDTVRAYHALMNKGASREAYNVCSGQTVSIKFILESLTRMSTASVQVEIDLTRYRPGTPVRYYGDHSLLTRQTGWVPEIPLERSLLDTLTYWRSKVCEENPNRV